MDVQADQDDRWAKPYESRFLARAGCSATKLRLTALEHVPCCLGEFLIKRSLCTGELGNLEKQAIILTSFTDFVLSKNANRWRNIKPSITIGELRVVWNSFFSTRTQSVLAKKMHPRK
jgi:hypothetical protein